MPGLQGPGDEGFTRRVFGKLLHGSGSPIPRRHVGVAHQFPNSKAVAS